jgi:hypothetical protein
MTHIRLSSYSIDGSNTLNLFLVAVANTSKFVLDWISVQAMVMTTLSKLMEILSFIQYMFVILCCI